MCVCMCVCVCHCICNDIQLCVYICAFKYISLAFHRGMGTVFRKWFGEVSQLRSLLPSGIPFVALTATSTTFVRRIIIDQLLMENVAIIEASPERRNIRYSVVQALL